MRELLGKGGLMLNETERTSTMFVNVSITVPSVSSKLRVLAITRQRVLTEVQTGLAECFGGSTTVNGHGSWIDAAGELITERVSVVSSYIDKTIWLQHACTIRQLALSVCAELAQDCVLLTVSPVAYVNLVSLT